MMPFPLTLTRVLERAERLFGRWKIASDLPDKSAHRSNHGDLWRRARMFATALAAAEVEPGERVATLMWTHASHFKAYLGARLRGLINIIHHAGWEWSRSSA